MAQINGHEYVDLGLPSGILWSKYDYGSSSETSAGGSYTWGGSNNSNKYILDPSNPNCDYKTVLELSDDIINKNWGENWCIPTKAQFEELIRCCSISGDEDTNLNYRKYSRNGNYLKFPGKYSEYWTNELENQDYAYTLYNDYDYDDGDYEWDEFINSRDRTHSYRIRPVWVPSLQHTINVYDNGELIYTETLNRGELFTYKLSDTSDLEFLGYVDKSGKLYTNPISINSDLNLTVKWLNKIPTGSDNSHDYVDLGLPSGTKWATTNVGATTPEDRGNTYAWGEIETKTYYSQDNYRFWIPSNTSYVNFSKYVTSSMYGNVDNKTILELSDDAANYNWGGNWRIPSKVELNELKDNCQWIYTKRNNSLGYLVLSKTNNNWIFLPETGSSSSAKDCLYLSNCQGWAEYLSYSLQCNNTSIQTFNNVARYNKYLIRPINKELTLNVTFYSNNLNNEALGINVEYAQLVTIFTNQFQNGTSLFVNWNTQSDGFGTQYSENEIITQLTENLDLYAQWFDYQYDDSENGHDYIDLGLPSGTLWATCNMGASMPTDFGEYYAWGETEIKSTYSSSNYKWYKDGDSSNVLKYNTDLSYGIVDNKVNLDLEDDAARVNWGGNWQIPSNVFFKELIDNCIFEYCGSYIKLTSKTNNKILYFPYSKYSEYLSSSYLSNYYCGGITLYDYKINLSSFYRYDPTLIRPIIKRTNQTCTVTYKNDGIILKTDTVSFGDRYLVTEEIPIKEGYLFSDWNNTYGPKALIDISSDVELEAAWDKAIVINLIDQSEQIKNTLLVRETTSKYLPSILVDKGYYCKEYNTQLDGSGDVYYFYNYYNFAEDINLYAQYEKLNTEYIDLDLPSKTLWGKCNIGDVQENIRLSNGLRFWFGDPLSVRNRKFYEDYKYIQKNTNSTNYYTKYTLDDQDYDGIWYDENQNFIGDGKSVMDKEDDPAYNYLGGNWRTPTKEQLEELLEYCYLDLSSSPRRVVSKTDSNKYIYLPTTYSHYASGYEYLVNTLNTTKTAYYLPGTYVNTIDRDYSSLCIRPVMIPYSITYKNENFEFVDYGVEFTIKNPGWVDSKKYVTSFNTELDGSGTTYNIGDVITLEEDLTLYAIWEDKLIVNIDSNVEGTDIKTYYYLLGDTFTFHEIKWDKFHKIEGYSLTKAGSIEYKVGDSISITDNITFYAVWRDLTNGVEYIDLGLPSGNIWAKEDLKGHYAWGEVETKSEYYTTNYKHSESNWNDLIKYNSSRNNGKVDNKKTLELVDDIANVVLKSTWHTPSVKDWQELIDNCTLEYTADGVKLISKINQNYITLKSNGIFVNKEPYNEAFKGYYWTNERNKKQPIEAYCVYFNDKYFGINSENRPLGLSIKAVINLGKSETPDTPTDPDTPVTPEEPEKPEEPELPDNPGTSTDVEEIPETGEISEHKIGTYNIRYWNGENDSNNQGEIAWPNRKDGVLNFLCGKYGGAVFGLQEITSQMYPDLQISDSIYYGYGRDNGQLNENASGEQISIFKNSTAPFQILRYGSFFYKTKEKSSFNRLCVWALVQSTINGKKFYIFNNHLAHDSATVRKQQVEILLKKVEEIAGDNIVFIVGDFNLTEDEETYSLITAKYNDAYKLASNPQGGYNGTNHTYTGLYSTTDTTSKRVDYIFTNLDTVESYIADNANMELEKYPSDHLPVVSTFKF